MEQPDRATDRLVVGVFIVCSVAWVAWPVIGPLVANALFRKEDLASYGQYGDLYGGLNALFTGLAFAAVWWTGRMQRKELELQRRELELQRGELTSTREVFRRQNFETTFFNQLQLFREIRSSISFRNGNFAASMTWAADRCATILSSCKEASTPDEFRREVGARFIKSVFEPNEAELGPYFRSLYHIFKLVSAQDYMSHEQQTSYANLARAQLSVNDLVILCADLTTELSNGFRPLVERYGILRHLRTDYDWRPALSRIIDPKAFMTLAERQAIAIPS